MYGLEKGIFFDVIEINKNSDWWVDYLLGELWYGNNMLEMCKNFCFIGFCVII